jgi:ubiquinone/menaquinone biosynthesis C-methylase UbiE
MAKTNIRVIGEPNEVTKAELNVKANMESNSQSSEKANVESNSQSSEKAFANSHINLNKTAIEIGARDGGLSLWLAQKGIYVTCSDLHGPTKQARILHERYGVANNVEYRAIDVSNIDAPDASYDIVLFKSVVGNLGQLGLIDKAMKEIFRVLKPDGLLLFAENMQGSRLHGILRRRFVPWGKSWYYVNLQELNNLLTSFSQSEIRTYGFLSCMRKDFAAFVALDKLICKKPMSPAHYMAFGHARK